MPAGPAGGSSPQWAAWEAALQRLREELQQLEGLMSGTPIGAGGGGGSGASGGFPGFLGGGGGLFSGGGGDFVSPTVGLIIKPNGQVEYDFEGHVKALGLDLPEGTSFEKITEEIESLIAWEAAGKDQSFIAAVSAATTHFLILRAHVQAAAGRGIIRLQAETSGGASKRAELSLEPSVSGQSTIKAIVGAHQMLIVDDTRQSTFVQNPSIGFSEKRRELNRGVAQVTWGGVSAFSNGLKISHGLNTTPVAVMANAEGSASLNFCMCRGFGVSQFEVFAVSVSGVPAAGTKDNIQWLAMT